MKKHEKAHKIAINIFGRDRVRIQDDRHEPDILVLIQDHVGFQGFDPYGNSASTYIVQNHFEVGVCYDKDTGRWIAQSQDFQCYIDRPELREAICDCAIEILG